MNTVDYSTDPYAVEEAQLARRRQLAELLLQQGSQNTPILSPWQGVARVVQSIMGNMDLGKAEREQRDLAQKRQSDRSAELDKLFSTLAPAAPQPYLDKNLPQRDDEGNPMPGSAAAMPATAATGQNAGRLQLARVLAGSQDPQRAQTGLDMLLKGPEAPIVKESDGRIFVLSPDGSRLLNQYGGGKVAPPNVADVTPESLAEYQRTGDASVLKPRIKTQAVNSGGRTDFIDLEHPPAGGIPNTMSPGEAATDARTRAQLRHEGVDLGYDKPAPQVAPGTQSARDDEAMKLLLGERDRLAAEGKSDPMLEREIALRQKRAGAAPTVVAGLSPKGAQEVAKETQGALAKGGVDYKTGLDQRVATGADLMMRLNESQQALEKFQPGMGAELRLNLARAAQATGLFPDSVIKRINDGDVAAKQEFQKLAAQQAMETLKQAMGGSGRITQAEFKVFQANNPNIELDPDAIKKIFDFQRRVFLRDQREQASMGDYLQSGGNIAEWPAKWTQTQMREGLMNQAPGAAAVPPPAQRELGKVYQTPRGPARWKGNGWELVS